MTLWGKLVQRIGRVLYCHYGSVFNGNAARHIIPVAAQWCTGRGIDFGAGRWPFPGAAPIDLDTTLQLDRIRSASQDYVFSSHCLEHVRGWRKILREFQRVLKPGGVLFLYLPHESMALWNPEMRWGRSAGHVWQPRFETLLGYAQLNDWTVLARSPVPDEYWSWFIVLRKEPVE